MIEYLYIFLSFFFIIINCKAKKTEGPNVVLKNQTTKLDNPIKGDGRGNKVSNSMIDAAFNKRINPPQALYEEQVTQKSVTIKLNHDDDTLKNIESLRPDNLTVNSKQRIGTESLIKKA
uniref:Uncharacterized protein n=1 Tax=Strongyloides stercoralis TaxID=6248 RepID=A0A0K0EQE2_STRER